MLGKLLGVIASGNVLDLILDPEIKWNSLKVRYETPHVDRLWIQLDEEYRLNLHRIYPCHNALMHPHPWPSAVYIVSGKYLMNVSMDGASPTIATSLLAKGSGYEMLEPRGWHSVKPAGLPSLSLMLTGKPWKQEGVVHPGKGLVHEPMSLDEQRNLLNEFQLGLSMI